MSIAWNIRTTKVAGFELDLSMCIREEVDVWVCTTAPRPTAIVRCKQIRNVQYHNLRVNQTLITDLLYSNALDLSHIDKCGSSLSHYFLSYGVLEVKQSRLVSLQQKSLCI